MRNHEEEYLLRKLVRILREKELPWQDWMEGFLEDLERNGGNASIAIQLSERSRDTVYKYRRRNPEFARRWTAIIEAVEGGTEDHGSPRQEPTVSQPRAPTVCKSTALARRGHRRNLPKLHRRQR